MIIILPFLKGVPEGEGFMRLHYKNYLKPYARQLRKSGNLSEVLLWNEIKKDKLGHRFLRQRPIKKYIVDFYCSSLNLAIEIDGVIHDYKIQKDEIRQKNIESLGITIIRFLDRDVRYNLEGVVETIKTEILRLVNEPPPLKRRNKYSY